MNQITVKVQNRVGALSDVCELLGSSGINILGITAYGEGDSGVIRVITNDVATTERILKQNNYPSVKSDILLVRVKDRPGELGKLSKKIAKANVNIYSIYMLGRENDEGIFAVSSDQNEKLKTFLV